MGVNCGTSQRDQVVLPFTELQYNFIILLSSNKCTVCTCVYFSYQNSPGRGWAAVCWCIDASLRSSLPF